MTNDEWKAFFEVCGEVLGKGDSAITHSESWCSWTTFDRLATDAGYWQAGLPNADELRETHIADGGTWGQPFSYRQLAHVIVPRTFEWETVTDGQLRIDRREQDIDRLSAELNRRNIDHRNAGLVLEIKLF